jgi:aryl-alcohol dehydrogenase-like predicted oxidoreductase
MGYSVHDDQWQDNFEETLHTLNELIKSGKIRHWGLSNETPWGVMRTHQIARDNNYPLPVSIQNPYNLLNRTFEVGLAEIAIRENMGLLAYSPMAFGLLSGKYHMGKDTPSDRINQFKNMARYNSPQSYEATARYIKIAEDAGLSPAQLSLAYVNNRPFVTSTIIGATQMDQLKENIGSIHITLSDDTMQAIDAVHREMPNTAP